MTLLLRRAEVFGGVRCGPPHLDVRIVGGVVAQIGWNLPGGPGDEVLDAAGGAVLPGLADHHLHLFALAAADASVPCGPPAVTTRAGLVRALSTAESDRFGWVRGIGYADSVAGPLDAAALDALQPHRPVRVQHRSGAMWTLNSAGLSELGLPVDRRVTAAVDPGVECDGRGTPTGRLWRADAWLRARLPPVGVPDLRPVGRRLASLGITHVTDATPDLDPTASDGLAEAAMNGSIPQHVHVLGAPLHAALPGRLTTGPYKIVLADSGLPVLDELVEQIRAAHEAGRGIAAHCVTREALLLLLAALDDTGPHHADRIEHAALVPAETVPELARRGLAVVTQPGFLADRGHDYLRDVPSADQPDLYRCASLRSAGIPVALSSDAPHGPLDPWAVIAAAVHRPAGGHAADADRVVGPAERIAPADALQAYLAMPNAPGGRPRRIAVGEPADLVVLDRPLREQLSRPDASAVRAVVIAGSLVHGG